MKFEELRVLQAAEVVADSIWQQVVRWDAFGRFHYGEKLQFLYYARGSLFETKYWLNRALERNLMQPARVRDHACQLTNLARQLNSFASDLKAQRRSGHPQPKTVREPSAEYLADWPDHISALLFVDEEIAWLAAVPNT